jgi:hypothetical protein
MFRNNVGVARYHDGIGARTVRYGLCPGSSDLIGWTTVDGKAVFTAIETKANRAGTRCTEAQLHFLEAVRQNGGIAGVANSAEEAVAIVNAGRGQHAER